MCLGSVFAQFVFSAQNTSGQQILKFATIWNRIVLADCTCYVLARRFHLEPKVFFKNLPPGLPRRGWKIRWLCRKLVWHAEGCSWFSSYLIMMSYSELKSWKRYFFCSSRSDSFGFRILDSQGRKKKQPKAREPKKPLQLGLWKIVPLFKFADLVSN